MTIPADFPPGEYPHLSPAAEWARTKVRTATSNRHLVCWCTDGQHHFLKRGEFESAGEAIAVADRLRGKWEHTHRLVIETSTTTTERIETGAQS